MGGIYLHIPFCKQACHYCDFHFSTNRKRKPEMVQSLAKELLLRSGELGSTPVATIYFGGGTPSLLEAHEIQYLLDTIYRNYKVVAAPEITLEANPDDLWSTSTPANQVFHSYRSAGINRLSIGIQSFYDTDLKVMNRAHNAEEGENCIREAKRYFKNISIDLIYGIPGMTDYRWEENIAKALSFDLPHISSYALTVEPKTALHAFIQKGIVEDVDDEQAQRQFYLLEERLAAAGYQNYEISNFGKPGFFSQNNTAYWQGKTYLGIGPSAHSFDGSRRGWNVRNNITYLQHIQKGKVPITYETLSVTDRYNEYVMTGLRTIWGVSLEKVGKCFGTPYRNYLERQAKKYVNDHLLFWDDTVLLPTRKGKFLVDGIASDLFMLNLKG